MPACMSNTSTESVCLRLIFTAVWKKVPVCCRGTCSYKESTGKW